MARPGGWFVATGEQRAEAWADDLVALQALALVLPASSNAARPALLRRRIDAAVGRLRGHAADAADLSVIEALQISMDIELARQMPRLLARRQTGRVRWSACAANRFVSAPSASAAGRAAEPQPGEPARIPRLLARGRWRDGADDLADLFAALHLGGEPSAAWRLANRWLHGTGDVDAMLLLPLFATAHALAASARAGMPRTRLQHLASARALLTRRDLRAVVLTGVPDGGRSRLARSLSESLGAVWLRSEALRPAPSVTAGPERPEAITAQLVAVLCDAAQRLLAGGLSVVIDSPALRRADRTALLELTDEAGALAHLVECHAGASLQHASMEPGAQPDVSRGGSGQPLAEPLDDTERARATRFDTDLPDVTLEARCRSLARWIDETADLPPVERVGWRAQED
jgi:hypothetical protein